LRKVLFDSSFLIAVIERPTTWYEDITYLVGKFEPTTLDCILDELESLSRRGGKRARYASLARELAEGFAVGRCGKADTDDEIVSYAKTVSAAVATVDGELLSTLRAVGVTGLTLRGGRASIS
jgi:rRNA-processing protein FCF1